VWPSALGCLVLLGLGRAATSAASAETGAPDLLRDAARRLQGAAYDDAAERYEAFARLNPRSAQAADALKRAAALRAASGERTQTDEAIQDLERALENYGDRPSDDADDAYLRLAEIYETSGQRDRLAQHLERYLRFLGTRGQLERRIEAHFRLGELAWKASCPAPTDDGSCVAIQDRPRCASRFGLATIKDVIPHDRERAAVAEARRHLLEVAKLWRRLSGGDELPGTTNPARRTAAPHVRLAAIFSIDRWDPTAGDRRALHLDRAGDGVARAVTGAAFYLAEAQWEAFLRIRLPSDLDFSVGPGADAAATGATRERIARSQRRFTSFLQRKSDQFARVRGMYRTVFEANRSAFANAGAARLGQLYRAFDGQLHDVEAPHGPQDQDRRVVVCRAQEDSVLTRNAAAAFERCLDAAAGHARYDEWSRLCEQGLQDLEPSAFPIAREMRPQAGAGPARLTLTPAPLVSRLDEPSR
jgi:tetratricopeptide (TPR) repeat protein